ncbi:MAG TPA: LuxR C-terminal-related transcriptional regulator [Blastocatellia bacterium]|nr:LuxR C-terminal-related transcriptional regulator [Blastocatellia bacterium]
MVLRIKGKSDEVAYLLTSGVVTAEMALNSKNSLQDHYDASDREQAISKLWLNHTQVEHQLYEVMLAEVTVAKTRVCAFSLRQLMVLTKLPNYSAIRRGLNGLINKHSVERYKVVSDEHTRQQVTVYFVFTPEEILERNSRAIGKSTLNDERLSSRNSATGYAIARIVERKELSRREAEVALCCVEGLTNLEIGKRLYISEQTVKFHLRHIFVKYGVKRRTELISQLLSHIDKQKISEELTE